MSRTLTVVVLAVAVLASSAARAGAPDVPDEINARLARTKVQAATDASARARAATAADSTAEASGGPAGAAGATPSTLGDGCNIAIGNVFGDKGRIGTSAKRETTVIVTGDVIQVGNNCR